MRYFCTYFDNLYLPRVLSLYDSLQRHLENFTLYAFCLDGPSENELRERALSGLVVVTLREVEGHEPRLLSVRDRRSKVEYYFTCGPAFIEHTLERVPEHSLLTYLDADLYFFSSPEPIFDELEDSSVGIIPQRLSPHLKSLEKYGMYNVGWISFRRDALGLKCLRWWKERCIEWCYDRVEGDKYADQRYLDRWPLDFEGVKVIGHPGANLAPWNIANHKLELENGGLRVDRRPLVFFHFSGLSQILPWLYNTNMSWSGVALSPLLKHQLFRPYLRELKKNRFLGGAARRDPNYDFKGDFFGRWLKGIKIALRVLQGSSYYLVG